MKSPSSSSLQTETAVSRDDELVEFVGSVVDAARVAWPDRFVIDFNARGAPNVLYTETHYALSAVLLHLVGRGDRALLDLAASRLRMWDAANGDKTFFNAMAYCLTAIALSRSGEEHTALRQVLTDLLARTRENRHVGYGLNCGNNAYLQQVAIDTVLLPVARGAAVSGDGVKELIREFRKYRTPEGFFFDLPRERAVHELLCPPTYIMKMLFLVGICHELHPIAELEELFSSGMASVLPLLSRTGDFSYFGRTDNSPFAAGLTIFNLRKAARLGSGMSGAYDQACIEAERHYRTFPRTTEGVLSSNRFADPASRVESERSRDVYAYDGQYSLSSCAYALLACHWFPTMGDRPARMESASVGSVAVSRDLGLARLRERNGELIVRTSSQLASWDRRYLGPTILRYQVGDRLLVGAISKTLSADAVASARRASSALHRVYELLQGWVVNGNEQLDGVSVGFIPVLRRGAMDYLPYTVIAQESTASGLRTRYNAVRLHARGYRHCALEAAEMLRSRIRGPKAYRSPRMTVVDSVELTRDIRLEAGRCRIEDRWSGRLGGAHVLFSTRQLPGVAIHVRGLRKVRSATGWGSDGRQIHDVYDAPAGGSELTYECEISLADSTAH